MKHSMLVTGIALGTVVGWAQFNDEKIPIAETHERRLQLGKTWVEVVGVCTIPETGQPSCWGLDGRLSPNLTKNVQNAINASSGNWSNLSIRPGKKNRLVVYRMERRWDGTPVISTIGTSGASLWLHSEQWPGPEGQRHSIETSATTLASEFGATQGVLRVRVTETVPRVQLVLKAGSEAIVAGKRVSVVLMSAGNKGAPRLGNDDAKTLIRLSGDVAEHEVHLARFLNPKGVEVGRGAFVTSAVSLRSSERPVPLKAKVFKTALGYDIWLNVEPAKLGKMVFGGTRDKPVGISGIPLDPRPAK